MQRVFGPPFGSIPMQTPVPFQHGFMPMSGGMSQVAPFARAGAGTYAQGFGGSQAIKGGGGLLAKFFGGGGANAVASSQAATGGMNLTSVLTNTQRVLGLTQQVMPMVQQYGPIIRNVPAIWRIMRSSNDSSSPSVIGSTDSEKTVSIPIQSDRDEVTIPQSQLLKPKSINGIPAPKLYV